MLLLIDRFDSSYYTTPDASSQSKIRTTTYWINLRKEAVTANPTEVQSLSDLVFQKMRSKEVAQKAPIPSGHLAIVFTDIKSSCALWESSPEAMNAAVKMHNEILRNELKAFNGYEVKTVGDGFMVSFQVPTAALLWSLSIQSILSAAPWPTEISYSSYGRKPSDRNGCSSHGLSVRVGAHWGTPLREPNPITERMDYFGDMVNRASQITSLADGGEIIVSGEFLSELQYYFDPEEPVDRLDPVGSDIAAGALGWHDPAVLNTRPFDIKDLGMVILKGLEKQQRLGLLAATLSKDSQ